LRCASRHSPIRIDDNACLGGKAMRTRIWASIVVVAFVVPLLAAQVDFGAINGVVTDSSGAVLPVSRLS